MAITHKYTIVCEQIRKEDNGKLILLGVYTPNIASPQLPFVLPSLTFFTCLESDKPGRWGLKFKLSHLESGKQIVEGMGELGFGQPGLAFVPIPVGAVQLQAVGVYTFSMQIEDQAEPILTEFAVTLQLPKQG